MTEDQIQIAVMQYLRWNRLTKDVAFHPANERRTSLQQGAKLKAKGVLAGVADIVIPIPTSRYHHLYLELKTEKGKLSPMQANFLSRMNDLGNLGIVTYSVDEAVSIIDDYLK